MVRLAATLLATLALAGSASPLQTPPATIVDANRDNRLEPAAGEPHLVRSELAAALPGREARRLQLLHFAQLTDTQLVDEESPARVEFIDRLGPPFEAAYRVNEGLGPYVLNEEVRAVNRGQPQLVMTTGDNVDNTQLNETRWFIDTLGEGNVVDPDSGLRGSCKTPRGGPRYHGVRGARRYYEPNRSGGVDGPGYSPSQTANRRAARRSTALRDYPGLLEDMNRPFVSVGLDAPWYAVFGNHDALVQGNLPGNAFFSQVASGCTKVRDLSARAWRLIAPLAPDGITAEEEGEIIRILYGDVLQTLADPKARNLRTTVPRDPRRALLTKREWMQQHFRTRGRPAGHGFTPDNLARSEGNYAFAPAPGVRFVVIDTVADTGSAGNLDDAQFDWLHAELASAEARREIIVLFGHHSLRTMRQAPPSGSPPVHYGLGACATADPAAPSYPGEPLRCLLNRHRGVIAYVNGHEHRNRVEPQGTFWEVVTAAHVDWPQQSRDVELFDNRDGTLSIRLTAVDHTGPPRPPARPRTKRRLLTAAAVARLASIARELAFNDPQTDNGEDGTSDRRGTPLDRNVELLVARRY